MINLMEQHIDINNKKYFYINGGRGKPVVFLHGTPTSSYLWRNVLEDLFDDFSIYAPDLPGFALSENLEKCSAFNYSMWLYQFIESAVPDQKVDLVLYSISGPIGIIYALQHPQKVRRIVICNTVISKKELSSAMKFILSPQASHAYRNYFNKTAFRLFIKTAVKQRRVISDRTLNKYHKIFERDQKEQTTEKLIKEYNKETEDFILKGFAALNKPVLVLWAEKDAYIPILSGKILHSNIRNSLFETLPNCGHLFPEEEPGLVADRIRNFLT